MRITQAALAASVLSIFSCGLASAQPAPGTARHPAPAPAPSLALSSVSSVTGSSLGGITQSFPLKPYLNGTVLLPNTLLQNLTIRFIGEYLADANQTFRDVVESTTAQIYGSNNLILQHKYRPGVMVPVYGPSGLDGTRAAYAPTPGQVPANFGRKLRQSQKPFTSATYKDRFTVFMSVDVEVLVSGASNSSLVQIIHPSQLMGYLSVVMAQKAIQVQNTPINISTTSGILPITRLTPLPTIYVLGTVLQVTGVDIAPVNTQAQTMIQLAMLGLYGSQSAFLFNRVGAAWQSSTASQDIVRFAIYTYTNTRIGSMNEIAGGDVATLMQQVAQATGANFTVLVVSSEPLGTQAEELAGSPRFPINITALPQIQQTSKSGLSSGQISGIVVGSVAGFVLAVVLVFVLAVCQQKPRRKNLENLPTSHPLQKAILGSGSAENSSGLVGSKGSTNQSDTPKQSRVHPLSDAWNIDPSELAVCQLPNGRDWLLGAGSFGQVFRGLRGGVQDVAIKQIIKPGDMHLRMFEKEVALLRHLNFDKNLVQFYGACVADDNLMLVLEYMDAGDLKEAIGNDPVDEFGWYGKGGSILMDVARGLHFLHSNRVAHRDLKTKNILLSKSGEAKIADVGLAKLVGSQLLSTQLDTAGTFAYAAPELLLGEPCDQSADIYSFGVIMWEIVTHLIPVRGDLRGIDIPKEAPQAVADLIERCLQRSPRARPTARELFEILQSLLSQPGASLPPVLEHAEGRSPSLEYQDESAFEFRPPQISQASSVRTEGVDSGYSALHTDETTSTDVGPHASPDAARKRLRSV